MSASSEKLFAEAKKIIPGGVNSPVRACSSVGCNPLFIEKGQGAYITSVDGDTYIDYVESWGPMLLGHAHPEVSAALHAAVDKGTSYGAPCEGEVTLAKAVLAALPQMDMVRMVSSGTEATMSALRLARGVTKRNKLVKFEGCYHGHADAFLASAGSGVATLSIPGTPGVPATVVADTLLAPYNDLGAVEKLFVQHGEDIAAVIVEPVAANMGLVLPQSGFLEGLRALCSQYGSVLIFDEVITGFRASFGGAQERFGIAPDLTTLGKIIGGGLPVGAYAGKRRFMEHIAPSGGVYQAGTLSGNPLAVAAGAATLSVLKEEDYAGLEAKVEELCQNMERIFADKKIAVQIPRIGSMFTVFFTNKPVINFATAKQSDSEQYSRFYQHMRANGVYLAPSAFETAMVSFAHSDADFAATLQAVESFAG